MARFSSLFIFVFLLANQNCSYGNVGKLGEPWPWSVPKFQMWIIRVLLLWIWRLSGSGQLQWGLLGLDPTKALLFAFWPLVKLFNFHVFYVWPCLVQVYYMCACDWLLRDMSVYTNPPCLFYYYKSFSYTVQFFNSCVSFIINYKSTSDVFV